MRQSTIQTLNQINKDFYQDIATDFSQTRSKPWQGWDRLVPYITQPKMSSFLDIGCGNGRFASFLKNQRSLPFSYYGIDSDPKLLQIANKNYPENNIRFEEFDIYQFLQQPQNIRFNCIGMFGVMHHIPSYQLRIDILQKIASLLEEDGLLCLSLWKFGDFKRFTSKSISWDSIENVDPNEIEDNDYLLNWHGSDKPRYCHHFSENEVKNLIEDSTLSLVEAYRADGKNKKLNQYLVLRKD